MTSVTPMTGGDDADADSRVGEADRDCTADVIEAGDET